MEAEAKRLFRMPGSETNPERRMAYFRNRI